MSPDNTPQRHFVRSMFGFRSTRLVLAAGLLAAGCARTESVDERVRRLVRDTSGRMQTEGTPLRGIGEADRRRGDRTYRPVTQNPSAAELKFVPAEEARDVTGRLASYAAVEGVPGVGPPAGATADAMVLRLGEALQHAQATGPEILSAQEEYLIAAISLLIERHQWGPRFFNDTSATIDGGGDDGDFSHAAGIVNNLRATQRLPSGGSVEASWVWRAAEQLRRTAGGRYRQSSEIVLSGTVPLLRGAGAVAREDLIQAERSLVYRARFFERFRRQYLVGISVDYFELLNTAASIGNQERQLASLRDNAKRTRALVQAGRLELFEQGIADNEVLNAEAGLASLREQYILQVERFKVRLGLPRESRLTIADDALALPEPEIDLDQAVMTALDLRLDLQNQRDQLEDSRRAVDIARNQLLPDLDARGSVSLPTDDDARVGSMALSPDDSRYSASLTLSLPLDRESERLRLRQTIIQLQQATREYERRRDEVAISVRASLRSVELARFQLTLAQKQVEINETRKRGQELQRDTIDAQRIVDTENALNSARNQRDRAQTNLRIAVLNYLLESDQLRVRRDGTLEPLPGMEAAPAAARPAAPAGTP